MNLWVSFRMHRGAIKPFVVNAVLIGRHEMKAKILLACVVIVVLLVGIWFNLIRIEHQKTILVALSAVKPSEIGSSLLKSNISVSDLRSTLIELNDAKYKEYSSRAASLSDKLMSFDIDKKNLYASVADKIKIARELERCDLLAKRYCQSYAELNTWKPGMSLYVVGENAKIDPKNVIKINYDGD